MAFAAEAVAGGAVAVLTDPAGAADAPDGVPCWSWPSRGAPRAAGGARLRRPGRRDADDRRDRHPGQDHHDPAGRGRAEGAGVRAGVIGTVGTRIAGEEVKTALTTPEAPDLHALFAVMRERDVTACAMEVSSHALVMGRVDGVVFDVAVFLNLGRDHLDFHADEEDYYLAKASLFTPERARLALVCVDDEHGRRLAGETALPVRTFSTGGRDADWTVADVRPGPDGSTFRILGPGVDVEAGVPLPGAFNVSNALAAVAACGEAGLDAAAVAWRSPAAAGCRAGSSGSRRASRSP